MTPEKAFRWLIFMAFATGFLTGQDYHTGFALVIRFLFQCALIFFVFSTLINTIHTAHTNKEEARWRDHQSQRRTKPSSKGMAATVAAAARATGTHVTVLETQQPSASSADVKRPDAGLDG